ncbi:MAG: iron ABC transporter substrate-binding protein [Microbacterium ginsengisoli]|uniref:iron ABC transporter substrate-binding protein n=1 Tax=Microbacterium TaxID=33882 RepID=UPI0006F1D030|nr:MULTISPECIES: iron ABC transporter substrate-binding protein [unclassified Microbacterium]MBN9198458.1 iron ABC transporter substrate-binding protein [Microbacterium ginsengisoli]KQR95752.1 iron ABC transporter substrate-binding protein [Microbacterium sp. Leaf351]KQR99131.1 iron ABC transporter substrate-binding protein [Microbacterium sp. Leaf347]ODU78094.1 MAG: iron ABC transporter substrate-binding protein [Microbacterium sp. SCN 71-21]OJU78144.1 MAG: iron ABC transporter substrate-bind
MPRRTARRLAAASAVLAVAVSLAACSSSSSPSASASGDISGQTITVYNAQHEELTQAWADAFTKQTGVKVVLRNGDDSELGNQIVQEGAASPADVFLTENSPAMSLVEKAGLFAPIDASTLDNVPAAYRPASGDWTGIAARSTVMVYNPSLISADQLPTSIMDLEKPEWKGKWAASPTGADFQAIVSAILQQKGVDATTAWLDAMKQNSVAYKGNSTVMKAVNSGQVPLGIIYHYYWFIDQSKTKENSNNTKLAYFTNQDPGAFVSISGGGVLKSSTHQQAAQAFIAFITSAAGQQVLRDGTSFEYAIGSGVASNPALPALDTLQPPAIDPSTLNSSQVSDLMTAAGLI